MKCISGIDAIIIDKEGAAKLVEMINFLTGFDTVRLKELIKKHREGFDLWQELKAATRPPEEDD